MRRPPPQRGTAPDMWPRSAARRVSLPSLRGIGMHEIKPGVDVQPFEQRAARSGIHDIPAHVRNHRGLKSNDRPRPVPAAWRLHTEFDPASKQNLHTDTDPSTGRPAATRSAMIRSPLILRRPAMHAAKAPTPGTTSPSAVIAASVSAVTSTSAPTRCSARWADRRFPEP